MRKADYSALAEIIKRQRLAARNMSSSNTGTQEFCEGKTAALEMLADCFARESSVDRSEFLKACGIE